MAVDKRISPFHCGTQYLDWQASNCERCKKWTPEPSQPDDWKCEIDEALFLGCMEDGTISRKIATRMGWKKGPPFPLAWECGEVEWTEEWKRECDARKGQFEEPKGQGT